MTGRTGTRRIIKVGAMLAVAAMVSACTGGQDEMGNLEDETDRLVEVVEMATGATNGAGAAQTRRDRQRGPCDPGRSSTDDPMGTSVVHAVEVTDLDPAALDDVIQRVADAWGVEVRPQDVADDGTVVHYAREGVTVSATSDKLLGRLSVSGETDCHPDA